MTEWDNIELLEEWEDDTSDDEIVALTRKRVLGHKIQDLEELYSS